MSDTSAGTPAAEPTGSAPVPPAPPPSGDAPAADGAPRSGSTAARRRRRRRSGAPRATPAGGDQNVDAAPAAPAAPGEEAATAPGPAPRPSPPRPRIGDTRPAPPPPRPVTPPVVVTAPPPPAVVAPAPAHDEDGEPDESADDEAPRPSGRSRRRSGRERRGRPVGRYLMCVHVRPHATQIAVLEGRTLVEHYVSRASDDTTQIDGNIYRGRVQNVLPGMEAAFIDIGTPKNAVLYRGDVRYDRDDIESPGGGSSPRIEQMLRPGQTILTQVTKNPIGAKGARLTQEVSLPGRFVVMVPNSTAFGISKRLEDAERRRLRRIVEEVRPAGHGLIVRTAAEGASQEELRLDVARLTSQWAAIEAEAGRGTTPGLLYREPDLAVRIVREEFNREYRGVVIDDPSLYEQVRDYVAQVNPELVDRVEYYDPAAEGLPVFERFHVHEQLHKALDRKVWLPSGGSIIIERTEALTVIDVNTGKNVGKSNLEETVYRNNLEAAEEIARQLRLRDIGGIIVIDFIDMEIRENRDKVAAALRAALARDKTRTQVFDISELGLVEMTRKRISEGLVESLSQVCSVCGGRGIVLDETLL
ncbi:MAG: Rne/Rng family ribonuclease [Acidimicrobiales bacterium]